MESPKIFFRRFLLFYIEVAVIHTLTYIVFGILFSNLLDYSTVFSENSVAGFLRGFESPLTLIGPFLQPVRAIFIAVALFPIRNVIKSRFGWIIVWLIFLCFGIISAPSSSPSSIEGIIYTKLPISFHLINLPEILLQTLSFSIILCVCESLPHNEIPFSNRIFLLKILLSLFIASIGIFLISVSGIIVMKFSGLDFTNAKLDKGTISFLSAILILTLMVSYVFLDRTRKNKLWLFLAIPIFLIIYIAFPYGYNYIFDTVYNIKIALIPYCLIAVIMSIFYCFVFAPLYGKIMEKIKPKENIIKDSDDKKSIDN